MARVHLLTVHPESDVRARGGYLSLLQNAKEDRFKVHQLVDDPAEADIILFAEIDAGRLCGDVLRHPYVKKFRTKCFMFSTDWRVIPFLPGVYTAVEKSTYLPNRSRPGFYPSCLINPRITFEPAAPRDLLYSFMGDVQTASVRRVLKQLRHPRGEFVDTSSESQAVMWRGTPEQREKFWQRYVDLMRRSKFVLCPRGVAASSIRLFETMIMGRVPVILSDEWIAPSGPRWDTFTMLVPEADALSVPKLLEEIEPRVDEMSRLARSEWEKHFASDIVFHRVVELCLEIQRSRKMPEWLSRQSIWPQLLTLHVMREYLRTWKAAVLNRR